MVQKTCYLEWQNLIAEASRGGYDGEVELNWDSYKILDVQLQQEWLESIKQRKSAPRPKVCKRAPKSPEQRRKISEAISAKWADPGYRERVCSAMTKYHGLPIVAERKRMKRPSGTQSIRRSLAENNPSETSNFSGSETKSQGWSGLKRSSAPSYRDPLANSKLKMIKKIRMKRPTGETQYIKSRDEKKPSDAYNFAGNETKSQCWSGLKRSSALSYKDLANSKLKLIKIRAQRAAMETKKKEAIERAKLLIAEAEKATKALELVAMKSPIAGASLTESRKLVAEAIRLIEEIGQITPRQSKTGTNGLISHFKEETVTGKRDLKLAKKREVHGTHIFSSISSKNEIILDIGGKLALQEFNCGEEPPSKCCVSPPLEPNSLKQQSVSTDQQMVHLKPKGSTYYHSVPVPNGVARMQAGKANTSSSKTKKWLRGRLVEVAGD
ncbi:hypothetical protein HHK36_021954 [Tetracentron sinense]|uniref:Nuclease associated modular domain-containing protein n=1 Tax=Tetracentron sinense TaxID=13715 RepID=A0A835DAG2_TETSI|nr:hypothetical protein HHK36_021954 [Tetracentron sinense]